MNYKMIQGYVYILKSELGVYMIGRTKDLETTINQLHTSPLRVELVHSIACEDDAKYEQELLIRFRNKRKTGNWFELTEDDIEELKETTHIKADQLNFEIIKVTKEQKQVLLEVLHNIDVQNEGIPIHNEVNITHPKLTGEAIVKSYRVYTSVIDEFAEYSRLRKESQKDLLSLALIEFMEKYPLNIVIK